MGTLAILTIKIWEHPTNKYESGGETRIRYVNMNAIEVRNTKPAEVEEPEQSLMKKDY